MDETSQRSRDLEIKKSAIELVTYQTNHFRAESKKSLFTKYQEYKTDHKLFRISTNFLKILTEAILVAWIVITILFFLIDAAPGKPSISSSLPASIAKAIEDKYHLNDPIFSRYINYLWGVLHLDFGVSLSIFPGVNINDFIWERFGISLSLGIISLIFTLAIGIPLGVLAGRKPGKIADISSTILISILISIPSLIFGLLLFILGRGLNIPYIYQPGNVITYILPSLTLALPSIVSYVKYIRTSMQDEINSEYAKVVYLKGTTRKRFVYRHALKPSLFPIVTFFPFVVLTSFLGGLFIEKIFMVPGSGYVMFSASQDKDVYVILFLSLLMSLITVMAFYLRDWLYRVMDPRLRKRG